MKKIISHTITFLLGLLGTGFYFWAFVEPEQIAYLQSICGDGDLGYQGDWVLDIFFPVIPLVLILSLVLGFMKISKIEKLPKNLTIAIVAGILISIISRFSFVVFTLNFAYLKIGTVLKDTLTELEFANANFLGQSGFPFHTYSDCGFSWVGTAAARLPVCETVSVIGEFSIILNSIFWILVVYGILELSKRVKRFKI